VLVRELAPLERFVSGGIDEESRSAAARVSRLPGAAGGGEELLAAEEGMEGAEVGSSMRAVAPPVQSFAAGRRR
jgi:hypothetical protein